MPHTRVPTSIHERGAQIEHIIGLILRHARSKVLRAYSISTVKTHINGSMISSSNRCCVDSCGEVHILVNVEELRSTRISPVTKPDKLPSAVLDTL